MTEHAEWDLQRRLDQGWSRKKAHELGAAYEYEYILDLAKEAGITPVPVVVYKLKAKSRENMVKDFFTFREHNFRVIDDETYEEVL